METKRVKLTKEEYLAAKAKAKQRELAEQKVPSFEDIKANMPSSDELAPIKKDLQIKKSEFQGTNVMREQDIELLLNKKSASELWFPTEADKLHVKKVAAAAQAKFLEEEAALKPRFLEADEKEGKEAPKKGFLNRLLIQRRKLLPFLSCYYHQFRQNIVM